MFRFDLVCLASTLFELATGRTPANIAAIKTEVATHKGVAIAKMCLAYKSAIQVRL